MPMTSKRHDELVSELGDVLWYVAMIAKELNVSLNEVALNNISKLKDRQQRDVISGDGDNR
jgi:NTP pyrophosphatase (non-canonical NTP hydrolase)